MSDRNCGPCCVPECKFPQLELCPRHKCIHCNLIIHALCGAYDKEKEEYHCPADCRKMPAIRADETTSDTTTATKDAKTTNNKNNTLTQTSFYYIGKDETEEQAKSRYKPVVDVSSDDFKPIPTIYRVTERNERGRSVEVQPVPGVLTKKFFPKDFVRKMVIQSNKYRENRLATNPGLDIWSRKTDSAPFTMHSMYHYIAILFYMGVVQLPCKDDYWSIEELMPVHRVCVQFGMHRNRFRFMWRHFHLNFDDDDDENENDEEVEVDIRLHRRNRMDVDDSDNEIGNVDEEKCLV